jgi:serine/threonine protein kinase
MAKVGPRIPMPATTLIPAPAPPEATAAPPELVAAYCDYEILRELGRGGMGVVYLARPAQSERLVALKVLARSLGADARYRERFRREAEIASRIHHPNIVPVHAVLERKDSLALVMPYIEGETLDVLIRRRAGVTPARRVVAAADSRLRKAATEPNPLAGLDEFKDDASWLVDGLQIFLRIARALRHVHACGIVHRDIKPGNILIDREGQPWLLDFGLARPIDVRTNSTTQSFIGTLHYLAPELLDPRRAGCDARADQYSLAISFYEFLTLRRPFADARPDSLFRAIATREIEPLRRHFGEAPAALEWVLAKALARLPRDRYADAGQFADELERVARGAPVTARAAPPLRRFRRALNANRPAAVAAACTALTWLGIIVTSLIRSGHEARRMESALRAADTAYERSAFPEALDHYHIYLGLGGDSEAILPRLNQVRRHLWAERGIGHRRTPELR